jgi:flagellar hook-associated protein 3 FlgL
MRITRNQIWDAMSARIMESTVKLAEAQERVTTGRRVNRPSDDPSATARIIGLRAEVESLERYSTNASEAQGRLDTAAESLTHLSDLLSEARTRGTWGGTETLNSTDREAIARDIDTLLQQAVSLANTRYGRLYLFAGTSSEGAPYERDAAIERYVFTGVDEETRIPVAPGLSVPGDMPGPRVFGGQHREATYYEGDTGAAAGVGTDSGRARGELILRHTDTVAGDGLGAGGGDSVSGVGLGASSAAGDTVLGNHTLALTVAAGGASGTISLDGGAAVAFTTALASDVLITNDDGDEVNLDLTGVVAGFTGNVNLLGNGTLSTDSGVTEVAIDFTQSQAVVDSRTDEVTHVDTQSVARTGTERLEYEGTFTIFDSLEALGDELRNVHGRSRTDQSDAISRSISALAEGHDDVLLALGTVGARSSLMAVSATQMSDLGFQLQRLRADLEDIDIAEAALDLAKQENTFQAALSVGARLAQPTLLDFL